MSEENPICRSENADLAKLQIEHSELVSMHPFSRQTLRYLNKFKRIYILTSGGKDSTYTILNLLTQQFLIHRPIVLLHTDTSVESATTKRTLTLIQQNFCPLEKVSFEVLKAADYLDHEPQFYVRQSAENEMDEAIRRLENGTYHKNVFSCCYWLKKKAFELWIKEEDHTKDCFVMAIKKGDSEDRCRFLASLNRKNTFYHWNIRHKAMYFYPLRDIRQKRVNNFLLQDKIFWDTQRSGCIGGCPVLKLFLKRKRDTA
jgi:3'-phosphoadenosine 5'-phosphosulfate sulfotransferase (PAPS reductase)/FAD synthetase